MRQIRFSLILVLIFSILLSGCNLPRAGGSTPTDSVMTIAAKTVSVQLTALVSPTSGTNTPLPTLTPPATATLQPATSIPPTVVYVPCDRAAFVADVSFPDGAVVAPNQNFTKTWRLQNNGSCTWGPSYQLTFDSGEAMGGAASTPLNVSVAPGGVVDVSVNLKAPAAAGKYRGYWKLRNSSGAVFGIGGNAATAFWVEVNVVSGSATPTATSAAPLVVYDFANNYCAAQWVSGAGVLPCPGTEVDAAGFVIRKDNPTLQNGVLYTGRALQTHPQWVDDGVTTGKFPPLDVQSGYRFKTTIGCLNGGGACDVTFQFNYRANGGPLQSLGQWNMKYTDAPKDLDVDVSSLAGSSVEFVLAVMAHGSSAQDWAIWFKPVIMK
ncbi:MAG: hypothetical protein IT308_10030 [Anaerolineaceae bacterium]|nr:hypothetical protein [Anaerolineaceae bacterium]